jgi:hypothetical protein
LVSFDVSTDVRSNASLLVRTGFFFFGVVELFKGMVEVLNNLADIFHQL